MGFARLFRPTLASANMGHPSGSLWSLVSVRARDCVSIVLTHPLKPLPGGLSPRLIHVFEGVRASAGKSPWQLRGFNFGPAHRGKVNLPNWISALSSGGPDAEGLHAIDGEIAFCLHLAQRLATLRQVEGDLQRVLSPHPAQQVLSRREQKIPDLDRNLGDEVVRVLARPRSSRP